MAEIYLFYDYRFIKIESAELGKNIARDCAIFLLTG